MSSAEPPGSPDEWDPDDTGGVPVGPEPEPTGAGGAGSGGWGEAPRTEPFAVAALVWAIVSIVLPIVGTIVALVLSARAADAIRRSRGTRSGTGLVTAARVVAGIVIALWAIGLVAFLALRDDDSDTGSVAVPTQPSTTSTSLAPPTSTTQPLAATTTAPLPTTTVPQRGTVSVVPPPPPTQPITQPTTPATTESPTTQPTSPPTTKPPPTTSPEQGEERRVERLLLREGSGATRIGPSNRGVPDAERVVVTYAPGQVLRVSWAIDNGQLPLPDGDATCQSPPPPPSSTSTSTSSPTSTTSPSTSSTTTSTTTPGSTTTTAAPNQLGTAQLARREARNILNLLRNEMETGNLDVDGVQLVGTYPIEGASEGDVDVVQVFYTNADVIASWPYTQAFTAPPADDVQCLNPAFA